jgi:hypothetical protein
MLRENTELASNNREKYPQIFGNDRGFSEFLGFFPLHKEIDVFGRRIYDIGDEFKSNSESEIRQMGIFYH